MYKYGHLPNTVGMKKETDPKKFTRAETQLIEQLREHPEMMVRVQSILAITRNAEGPLQTADAVEALLIEEMRRLGHLTLRSTVREPGSSRRVFPRLARFTETAMRPGRMNHNIEN